MTTTIAKDIVRDISYLGVPTFMIGIAGEKTTHEVTFYGGGDIGMSFGPLGKGVLVRDPERFGPVPTDKLTAANRRAAKAWCQAFIDEYKETP